MSFLRSVCKRKKTRVLGVAEVLPRSPFGNSPATRVRRFIVLFKSSTLFDVRSRTRCSAGRSKTVRPSGMLVSIHVASLGAVLR